MGTPASWITARSAWYFPLLLVAAPVTLFLGHEWPNSPEIKGQDLAVAIPMIMAVTAILFWIFVRSSCRLGKVSQIALIAWEVLWLVSVISAFTHGSAWNYTVLITGLLPILFLIRPISKERILRYSDVFVYSLVALVLITELLAFTRGRPAHNVIPVHWGWISEVTGIRERWYGPFGYPSFAGIAGAYLVVYGFARNTRATFIVASCGGVMTVLSGQNTAVISAFIGILAVWILADGHLRFGLSMKKRGAIAGIGLLCVVGFALIQNPTLSLRTPLYPIFFDFWKSSPLSGVGTAHIVDAASVGSIPQGLTSAHNAFLDVAARFGLLGLVPFMILLVCGFVLAWKAWELGSIISLVLMVTFTVISLVEFQGDWTYLTIAMSFLFISVSLASSMANSKSSIAA